MSGHVHPRSLAATFSSENVDNIEAGIRNITLDKRVKYPDNGCATQGPLLNTDLSKCPMDKSSCSSQQKPVSQGHNFAIYDPDAPTGHKLKVSDNNIDFKEISFKEQKENWPTAFDDSEKSPIVKLNEIMLSKKQVVEYKLISIAGHVHSPVFRILATNNEIHAYGEGMSKKKAKKNAAIAFLEKLNCNNGNDTITSTTSDISPSKLSPLKYSKENLLDEISKVNPIGVLQEMCMARRWELPNYEFPCYKRNESHDTWYSVVCYLKSFKAIGEGKTKQAAKRNAAYIMYDQIKNVPENTKDYKHAIPSQYLLDVKECTDLDCVNNLQSLETFFNRLKQSQKQSLNTLRKVESTIHIKKNSIEFLSEIGKEENFNITYILLTKKSTDIEIVVQLAVTPFLLFIGTGRSVPEAQQMAAYVALSYIRLLLEK